jgi:peptide/nickel transport system permease protein
MASKIGRRFIFALLVFVGAGILVSLLLSLVPDYTLALSFGERVEKNLATFFSFNYGRTEKEYKPIGDILLNRGLTSLTLISGALAIVFLLGVTTGIFAALEHNSRGWKFWTNGIDLLSALPVLVWTSILILIVTNLFHMFPTKDVLERQPSFFARLLVYALPIAALALGDGTLADVVRVLREETAKILEQDFVRALRARGVGLGRHLLRSLIMPITAVFAGKISLLLAGTIVVEYIFNWRGLGFLILEAVSETGAKDYPLILAATMLLVGITVLLNFASETAAILSDPRLRQQ